MTTTRGRKPGSIEPTSLAAKLLTLAAGDTIYLNDVWISRKASPMERRVRDRIAKTPVLAARKFVTERWTLVHTAPPNAYVVLAITRTK
jgi:hypothetical protein